MVMKTKRRWIKDRSNKENKKGGELKMDKETARNEADNERTRSRGKEITVRETGYVKQGTGREQG